VFVVTMNDLLSRSFGRDGSSYVDLKKESRKGDVEMGEMVAGAPEVDMTQFFDEVGVIKGEMEKIKQLLAKVQGAHEESRTVSKAQAMKALRSRMDADIRQVTKIAKSIKFKLEELDKANTENRRVRGCEEGTPTDRTRTSITSTLRKKLKDLMGEFQILRQNMNEEYKETVERR
jgi:syntaxin 1B/2/3